MFRDFTLSLAGIPLRDLRHHSILFEHRSAGPWSLKVECDSTDDDVDPRVLVGVTARFEAEDQGLHLAASGVVVAARRVHAGRGAAKPFRIDIAPTDALPLPGAVSIVHVDDGSTSSGLLVAHSLATFAEMTVQLFETPGEDASIFERFGVLGAADRDHLLSSWRASWRTDPGLLTQWRKLYDARRRWRR